MQGCIINTPDARRWVEVVGCVLFPEMAVVINDEGRVRGLPYNQIASIASGFQIFGDAILLPEDVVR